MATSATPKIARALAATTLAALAMSAFAVPAADAADPHDLHMGQNMGSMSEGSKKIHQAMMGGMQGMQMSGDTDQDFAAMMIHHHQQAIAMARAQLEHGKDPQLKARAQKIIDDSQKDIDALSKLQKPAKSTVR